jgi:hypothetical protein
MTKNHYVCISLTSCYALGEWDALSYNGSLASIAINFTLRPFVLKTVTLAVGHTASERAQLFVFFTNAEPL